jgi:hypothetical protein
LDRLPWGCNGWSPAFWLFVVYVGSWEPVAPLGVDQLGASAVDRDALPYTARESRVDIVANLNCVP